MKFIFILLLVIATNLFSATYNAPSQEYHGIAEREYKWMLRNNDIKVNIAVSDDAKTFFTEDSLLRYFKLKLRGFLNKKNIQTEFPKNQMDYQYLGLKLELYKYNNKLNIYFGFIEMSLLSSIYEKGCPRMYQIIIPIAGSENQIIGFVKQDIDSIVEKFAEDYFYIEDLVKNK